MAERSFSPTRIDREYKRKGESFEQTQSKGDRF